MRFCLWSVVGGSGCTTVASSLASVLASDRQTSDVLLIDLAGDCAAAFGVPDSALGLGDWLADEAAPLEALARLETPTRRAELSILQVGTARSWSVERAEVLCELLEQEARDVVIDCGVVDPLGSDSLQCLRRDVISSADRSLLCIKACYLAVARAAHGGIDPHGIVLHREAGRSLTPREIERELGVPVVAKIDHHRSVFRCVDAGLDATRLPRSLRQQCLEAIR